MQNWRAANHWPVMTSGKPPYKKRNKGNRDVQNIELQPAVLQPAQAREKRPHAFYSGQQKTLGKDIRRLRFEPRFSGKETGNRRALPAGSKQAVEHLRERLGKGG